MSPELKIVFNGLGLDSNARSPALSGTADLFTSTLEGLRHGASGSDQKQQARRHGGADHHRSPGSQKDSEDRADQQRGEGAQRHELAMLVVARTIRTVGVIGPTRMRYSRAIALVDGTAQAVSRVLRDAN